VERIGWLLNRLDCPTTANRWIESHLHQLQVSVGVIPEIRHELRDLEDPHIFEHDVALVAGATAAIAKNATARQQIKHFFI
jgi:hypothetical protein